MAFGIFIICSFRNKSKKKERLLTILILLYLYESGLYHRVCKGCHDPGSSGSLDVIHASWTENPAASKMDKAESA